MALMIDAQLLMPYLDAESAARESLHAITAIASAMGEPLTAEQREALRQAYEVARHDLRDTCDRVVRELRSTIRDVR